MACLNCAACVGYVNGQFGPVTDDTLICKPNNALAINVDTIPELVCDTPTPTNTAFQTLCLNRLRKSATGELWAEPAPTVQCWDFLATDSTELNLTTTLQVEQHVTPIFAVFNNSSCFAMEIKFAVSRTSFLSTTGTFFQTRDFFEGVAVDGQRQRVQFGSDIDYRTTSTYMVHKTIAAFGAFTIGPFATNYSNADPTGNAQTVVYSTQWNIKGLGIMAKDIG